MTACRGGGIPTDRLGGLGQRDSGRWVKSCGDPAADAVGELSLRWVWGGVYFPSLSHDFFSQLWFLAGLTFQFPELILGSWDWLFLSDPGPRLSPSFDEFRPSHWLTQSTLFHAPLQSVGRNCSAGPPTSPKTLRKQETE